MKKTMGILISMLMLSMSLVLASSSWNIAGNLEPEDFNVFFGKEVVSVHGHYKDWFATSHTSGHLFALTHAEDGTSDILQVEWSSRKPGYGVEITQDDVYATKVIANAKVTLNGVSKYGQKVYVHYNKLNGGLVVRGYGFRIAT